MCEQRRVCRKPDGESGCSGFSAFRVVVVLEAVVVLTVSVSGKAAALARVTLVMTDV